MMGGGQHQQQQPPWSTTSGYNSAQAGSSYPAPGSDPSQQRTGAMPEYNAQQQSAGSWPAPDFMQQQQQQQPWGGSQAPMQGFTPQQHPHLAGNNQQNPGGYGQQQPGYNPPGWQQQYVSGGSTMPGYNPQQPAPAYNPQQQATGFGGQQQPQQPGSWPTQGGNSAQQQHMSGASAGAAQPAPARGALFGSQYMFP